MIREICNSFYEVKPKNLITRKENYHERED